MVRKTLARQAAGRSPGATRQAAARSPGVERLEGRRLLTVAPAGVLPNLVVRANEQVRTVHLAGLFSTDAPRGSAVEFQTIAGPGVAGTNAATGVIDVALDDAAAPGVVASFLRYVRAGAYDGTVLHRGVNFAGVNGADDPARSATFLQGGSYSITATGGLAAVTNLGQTALAYSSARPNVRGTFAIVPDGGSTHGSSGFLFNVADNSVQFGQGSSIEVIGTVVAGLDVLAGTSTFTPGSGSAKGGGLAQTAGGYASLPRQDLTFDIPRFGPTLLQGVPVVTAAAGGTVGTNGGTGGTGGPGGNPGTLAVSGALFPAASTVGAASAGSLVQITSARVLPASALTYTVISSDPRIVTGVTGAGANVTLTYGSTPGTSTVTIIATDGGGAQGTVSFTVTRPQPVLAVTYAGAKVATGQLAKVQLGSFFVGQRVTETLKLRNAGSGQLQIGTLSTNLPAGVTVLSAPATNVGSGRSTTLVLGIDTTVTGALSGTILIPNNASEGGSFALPLAAFVGQAVIIGAGGVKSVAYTQADGTRATLSAGGGLGTATVTFTGSQLTTDTRNGKTTVLGVNPAVAAITMTGSGPQTSLSVNVSHGGALALTGLSITGDIGQVSLPGVALSATVSFSGSVGTLSLASLTSAALTLGRGASAIRVSGDISDSTLLFGAAVGSISAARILNSGIFVGTISPTPPTTRADFVAPVRLGSVTATSPLPGAFSNTTIAAATLGRVAFGPLSGAAANTLFTEALTAATGTFASQRFSAHTPDELAALGISPAILRLSLL